MVPTDDLNLNEKKIDYQRGHTLVEVDPIWTKDAIIDDFVKDMKEIWTNLSEESLMHRTQKVCFYVVSTSCSWTDLGRSIAENGNRSSAKPWCVTGRLKIITENIADVAEVLQAELGVYSWPCVA